MCPFWMTSRRRARTNNQHDRTMSYPPPSPCSIIIPVVWRVFVKRLDWNDAPTRWRTAWVGTRRIRVVVISIGSKRSLPWSCRSPSATLDRDVNADVTGRPQIPRTTRQIMVFPRSTSAYPFFVSHDGYTRWILVAARPVLTRTFNK